MARLAAYYHQEDFKYAPIGYGTKQRKTAYVVYGDSNGSLVDNGGHRLRALAASEPSLSPAYSYTPKTAVMTLKAKPHPFDTKIVEQSRMAIQRLERMYESTECLNNPYAVSQLEPDSFDCESVYSHRGNGQTTYVKQHKHHKSKDRVCKRLSYDSCDSYHEMGTVDRYGNAVQVRSVDTVRGESLPHLEGNFVSNCEDCILPPVSFRSDSSHGRWQQWPWNMVDPTGASPHLLSPPSPLDSGLSSQSITSSPSLDAEPISTHSGQIQVIRTDGHHVCSCPKVYAEQQPSSIVSSPGRYDSGRSSPGPYSIMPLKSKKSFRKSGHNLNNGIVYFENDFEDEYSRGQVRYGMMGLLGEPVPQPNTALAKISSGKYYNPELIRNNNNNNNIVPQTYYYIEQPDEAFEKRARRSSKSHKTNKSNHTRPFVVITEASDKSNSSSSPEHHPHHGDSVLSPEPESSMSTDCSNSASKSSSVSSSNNDLENELRRKSSKRTENEIRELEDMYKKCNLGDHDLLERAERRDLPTAHQQTRSDQSAPLTRSKSDTFYEMLSHHPPYHHNPYQVPQRAPPLRRAGIPDIINDDMALRKHKKPVTTSAFNPADNTVTYMLCSSHFTPTVSGPERDILMLDNPDVEYDDLSYRKHYLGKKGKTVDPQPPFGIPLRPPPPQSVYNDYLHQVAPADGLRPLCHPRGNPDVVRDDMAFRTLRKDDPERIYYDSADVYKKKRG